MKPGPEAPFGEQALPSPAGGQTPGGKCPAARNQKFASQEKEGNQ